MSSTFASFVPAQSSVVGMNAAYRPISKRVRVAVIPNDPATPVFAESEMD